VVAATALNNLLLLIVLALYLKLRMGRIFDPLALRSTPWRGGLLFFLVTPCFAIAIEMLYSFCLQAWGVQPESQNIAALFLTTESVLFRSLMILFGVLLAPLAEEVVFRGILYPVLKQRCRTSVSIGLNGLVFGLAHFSDPQSILPVCFLGGFLAYSFERTKSLWVPILAHISNNLVAFGLLLISELIMNVTAH
jgi:membrane protease YdiL (CAAX protease family)